MKEKYETPQIEVIRDLYLESCVCAGSPAPGSNEDVNFEDW